MQYLLPANPASPPTIEIIGDGVDIFVAVDGVKIAKRGHPGTPTARTWIPLVAGYRVVSDDNHETIEIEYEPAAGLQ
jgi:hypothetical protein